MTRDPVLGTLDRQPFAPWREIRLATYALRLTDGHGTIMRVEENKGKLVMQRKQQCPRSICQPVLSEDTGLLDSKKYCIILRHKQETRIIMHGRE